MGLFLCLFDLVWVKNLLGLVLISLEFKGMTSRLN